MTVHLYIPPCPQEISNDSSGQILVEYGLLLLLIAIVVLLLVTGLGQTNNNTYSTINSRIGSAMQ